MGKVLKFSLPFHIFPQIPNRALVSFHLFNCWSELGSTSRDTLSYKVNYEEAQTILWRRHVVLNTHVEHPPSFDTSKSISNTSMCMNGQIKFTVLEEPFSCFHTNKIHSMDFGSTYYRFVGCFSSIRICWMEVPKTG